VHQARWAALISAALLLVTPSGGAATLVLIDGTTIEATVIRLVSLQVFVTLPDGRMVAYQADEVELEASGLLPDLQPDGEEHPPGPVSPFASVVAATSEPTFVIENDDVAHVDPLVVEQLPFGAATDLKVAAIGVRHIPSPTGAVVIGRVRNMETVQVRELILDISLIGVSGRPVAQGSTTVVRPLEPGQYEVGNAEEIQLTETSRDGERGLGRGSSDAFHPPPPQIDGMMVEPRLLSFY